MDVYALSRNFFDWSFENPEKIKPLHGAIFFFAIEHCNRLGWKEKFGFPTSMAMEAIGIKKWKSYKDAFDNLVEWGFIKEIEKSKNQYSSCIISIGIAYDKKDKALDKALIKHGQKQGSKQRQSTVDIDIQVYNSTNIQDTSIQGDDNFIPDFEKDTMTAFVLKYFFKLGWKPAKKETFDTFREWYNGIISEDTFKTDEKEEETIVTWYNYWNERKLEENMDNKNWKQTFLKTWKYSIPNS